MKKLLKNKIVQIGLMAFLVIVAAILFNYIVAHLGTIWRGIKTIIRILTPLIYGLVLAFIMQPIVKLFERKVFNRIKKDCVRRNLSITVTFVIIIGILAALISVIIPQILVSVQSLITNSSSYFQSFKATIMSWFSGNSDFEQIVLANYDTIVANLTSMLTNVVLPGTESAMTKLSTGIVGLISFFVNLAIGMVFAAYILANTKSFKGGIKKILYSIFKPERVNNILYEAERVNKIFNNFLLGKVLDSSIVAVCTLLFCWIFLRYPYFLLIAVIIGLTDLIPYFGPYIGTVPSALLICLVSPTKALAFIAFIIVLQQIDGNLITPRIQKQATGLPSFWVLFAITLFGGLFGIVGMLIAVPCFTIIYGIIKNHIDRRIKKKELPVDDAFYSNNRIEGESKKKEPKSKKTIKEKIKETFE